MTRPPGPQDDASRAQRREMIDSQLVARGIRDPRVLDAVARVRREDFLPPGLAHLAYADQAVEVGCGQTISQPFIVAYMTAHLQVASEHRVLEIGTGSGYQAAILAHLARHVYTVERLDALAEPARQTLAAQGLSNVSFRVGDGSLGWPEEAPFDRIIVTAAGPQVPPALTAQLAEGGLLVMPVGGSQEQSLIRVDRQAGRTREVTLLACRFVPLIGREGWQAAP